MYQRLFWEYLTIMALMARKIVGATIRAQL